MKVIAGAWRLLRGLALGLAAIILFVEEWGWRPLTALAAAIAKWPPLSRLEAHIVAAPPRRALFLFLAPAVLLFPLKIAALWLIDKGRAELGVFLIVVAKVVGTAIVGRLFILLEPQLMTFGWFARAVDWWRRTKGAVHDALRASIFWRKVRVARRAWRLWLGRMTH